MDYLGPLCLYVLFQKLLFVMWACSKKSCTARFRNNELQTLSVDWNAVKHNGCDGPFSVGLKHVKHNGFESMSPGQRRSAGSGDAHSIDCSQRLRSSQLHCDSQKASKLRINMFLCVRGKLYDHRPLANTSPTNIRQTDEKPSSTTSNATHY